VVWLDGGSGESRAPEGTGRLETTPDDSLILVEMSRSTERGS
jgi:hypothetical protein